MSQDQHRLGRHSLRGAVLLSLLAAISGPARGDELLRVEGDGLAGSEYKLTISIDGEAMVYLESNNQELTPTAFVALWKALWDIKFPDSKDKFVNNGDGTFELVGSMISVEIGPLLGPPVEVVGNPAGVPFNPMLHWDTVFLPSLSTWAGAALVGVLVAGAVLRLRRTASGPAERTS